MAHFFAKSWLKSGTVYWNKAYEIHRGNIQIVKIDCDLDVLINIHVFDLPESDKRTFGIMPVCM